MRRLFGLLAGNPQGPLMATEHFEEPTVLIRGMEAGTISLECDGVPEAHRFTKDGRYAVPHAKRMRFSYDGLACPQLQCLVISAR